MPHIGNKLKSLRQQAGLTQGDFSQKSGIPLPTIKKLEQNERIPRSNLSKKIADFFKIKEAELYIDFEIKNFSEEQIPVKKIPLISWVSANRFGEASDPYPLGDAEEWLYTTAKGERMFALKVKNDCMEPEFREGDRIIVNPNVEAASGDYVIVRDNKKNEATFKQLKIYGKKVILHPLNPKYEDIELDQDKRYVIVGKVVGKDKAY